MWHNAAVVGSQKEPAVERSSARTSGTTPSSVDQVTDGVLSTEGDLQYETQRSDDEEWYSNDEDEPAGEARHHQIAKHSALKASELSASVTAVAKSAGEARCLDRT